MRMILRNMAAPGSASLSDIFSGNYRSGSWIRFNSTEWNPPLMRNASWNDWIYWSVGAMRSTSRCFAEPRPSHEDDSA